MSDGTDEPLHPPQNRMCSATCADGERCAGWARRGYDTCYWHDPEHRCTARITGGTTDQHRAGERCLNRAIPGGTVCESHGGAAPQVRDAAEARGTEEKVRGLMAAYATPVETTPMKSLRREVCRAEGRVQWLEAHVQQIEAAGDRPTPAARQREDEDETTGERHTDSSRHPLVWGTTRIKQGGDDHGVTQEAAPSIWLKLYNEERDRLIKVSEKAMRAGLDERMVKLAETQGRMVADAIRAILDELGLTPDQWATAKDAAARHLRALTG